MKNLLLLLSFICLIFTSGFDFSAFAQKNQNNLKTPTIKKIPNNQVVIPNNQINPKLVIPKKSSNNKPSNNPNSNLPSGGNNSFAVPPPPPPPPNKPDIPDNSPNPGRNKPKPQIPRQPVDIDEIDVPEIEDIPEVEIPRQGTVEIPEEVPEIVPEIDTDDYLMPIHKEKFIDKDAEHVPNQILILYKGTDLKKEIISGFEADYKLDEEGIHTLSTINATLIVFNILDKQTVPPLAKKISSRPGVILAQPNYLFHSMGNETLQYGVKKINADNAHKVTTGKGIKVAVIDTGVDFNHEVLKNKVALKKDFVKNGTFTNDLHGTSVAGIIAARADSSGRIVGIAPDVNIIAAKACWYENNRSVVTCTSDKIAKSVDFAVLNKANVMNFSIGGPQDFLLTMLINKAIEEGTVVVAASGNGGTKGKPVYPAAMKQVIAVSATDSKDNLYKLSTIGDYIDLSAPGVDILSPAPGNKWKLQSGTSMSAAHVSGAVALLMQLHPELLPFQIKSILGKSSVDLGKPGRDKQFGEGRIDVASALNKLDINY